jgi:hypothetical protein
MSKLFQRMKKKKNIEPSLARTEVFQSKENKRKKRRRRRSLQELSSEEIFILKLKKRQQQLTQRKFQPKNFELI